MSPSLIASIMKHASLLGERTYEDYQTLNHILIRHEATIRKRWLKKSRSQRRDILLQAWPDMPENHRPDYSEMHIKSRNDQNPNRLKLGLATGDKQTLPSRAKTWPFINLEDLTKPKPLLIYLNARGRNDPFKFAVTERCFSPLAEISQCGHEPLLEHFHPYLSEEPSPTTSGKVNCCTKPSESHFQSKNGRDKCPRTSLQALCIQQKITEFLVTCTKLILHDLSQDMLHDGPVQEEPPYSDLEQQIETGSATFADILMLAPYRNRGAVDFVRLRAHFDALRTNAKDHILALREDPSYFADTFTELSEHTPKLVKDTRGQVDPSVDSIEFLKDKARQLIIEAYIMFFVWQQLYEITNKLAQTSPQNPRADFAPLMMEYQCTTRKVLYMVCHRLSYASVAPNVRNFYIRLEDHGVNPHLRLMPHTIPSSEEFQLISCFEIFGQESDGHNRLDNGGLLFLLDHMTMIMRDCKAARDLVSPRVLETFSQMCVVGECSLQLSVWYESLKGDRPEHCPSRCSNQIPEFLTELSKLYEAHLPVHTINPFRGKLAYPAHKAYNYANVRAMRTAESNLDKFWQHVDNFLEKRTGILQYDAVRQCTAEGHQMRRTPPWQDTVNKASQRSENSEHIYRPFSETSHDTTMQITGAFDKLRVEEKNKVKTKGSPGPWIDNTPQANVILDVGQDKPKQTFALEKHACKVMKALFYVPRSDSEDLPKAVKWCDFKRAMSHIGFTVEKLQGSAWQFTPSGALEYCRGIQFHEPHPNSDITYIIARRFGRRLERVYGWNSDSFHSA